MKSFICVCQGTTPLLMHRFAEENELERTTRTVHIMKKDPRETAEKAAYRMASGNLFLPGAAISRLLREAGASHKQRGSRKSLKYIMPAAVLVLEDQVPLRDDEGTPLRDFEVDSRPVVIPSTKGRIMCHRPRLNNWNMEFSLEIDNDTIDPDFIHQLITEGGRKLGVGDFRPEKGGSFGRFLITSWGVLSQKLPLAAD